MAEKRKDNRGRILKTGESQRADGTIIINTSIDNIIKTLSEVAT